MRATSSWRPARSLPQAINFMAGHARGLICLALTPQRVEELQLSPQAGGEHGDVSARLHRSIDARKGITTGISAADRATTIHVAMIPAPNPSILLGPVTFFRSNHKSAVCFVARVRLKGRWILPAGRAVSRGSHLRNHERGRHDGPRA